MNQDAIDRLEELRLMPPPTKRYIREVQREMKLTASALLTALQLQYPAIRVSRVQLSQLFIIVTIPGIGPYDPVDFSAVQFSLNRRVEVFSHTWRRSIRRNGLWFKRVYVPVTNFCVWRMLA